MQTVEIAYGEWLPSAPDYRSGGCVVANNVIPRPGGYGPLPGKQDTGQAVSGAVKGVEAFWGSDDQMRIVGGTASSLFVRQPGVLAEQTAGVASVGDGQFWDFARFNAMVVAVSPTNSPKYIPAFGSSTTWVDLPGNPPKARCVERVGNFLMLGGLEGFPNRIQWSAFNNPEGDWVTNRTNQSGFANLPAAFGSVQRITGGRTPIVFQERGISRLDYAGTPTVWRSVEIEQGAGCASVHSVVNLGFRVFYLSQDGFKATNGSEIVDIGAGRVNQWFFEQANQARLGMVIGAPDYQNGAIVWAWCSAGSDTPDRLLVYSWQQNRWASGSMAAAWLVGGQLDYDTLETIGEQYAEIEDVPVSLDDPSWQGRERGLAVFDTDGGLSMLQGDNLQADFQTVEMAPVPGRRVSAFEAWPLVVDEAQASTVAAVTRANDGTSATGSFAALGAAGFAPLRAEGRTMAIAHRIPAGTTWGDAQGVQVSYRVAGKR